MYEMSCRQLITKCLGKGDVLYLPTIDLFVNNDALTVCPVCGNLWFNCGQLSEHDTHLIVFTVF